jgi:hypothetical protein
LRERCMMEDEYAAAPAELRLQRVDVSCSWLSAVMAMGML